MAGVFDQAGSTMTAYLNNSGTSVTAAGTGIAITGNLVLGKNGDRSQYYFDGILDEVYITNDAKSNGWIETYYNNTYDPATFIITQQDFIRAISDNLSITDVIYQETAYNRDTQDNIGITDTNFATFIQIIEIAQDTVGITDDSLIRKVDFNKNIQDTVTLNDVIGRTANINRILDNSVGITDNVIGSKFIFSSVLDNIGITDSVTLKIVTSDVDNPIIEFYQIDGITPTIYNITNG